MIRDNLSTHMLGYELVTFHSLTICNNTFCAISSRVSRFRPHKTSLHSDCFSRIWTPHLHSNCRCMSRNVFASRFLSASRDCPGSKRSLTLHTTLAPQSRAQRGSNILHHVNWCADNLQVSPKCVCLSLSLFHFRKFSLLFASL